MLKDHEADRLDYSLDVLDDVRIPEAQDGDTAITQPFLATTVGGNANVVAVLAAIHFDREGDGGSVEIEDVRPERVLMAKADAFDLRRLKVGPELPFPWRRFAPEGARVISLLFRAVETAGDHLYGGRWR